jgi:hypothetical protein
MHYTGHRSSGILRAILIFPGETLFYNSACAAGHRVQAESPVKFYWVAIVDGEMNDV